jgi:methyltransferase (TIGR00027 family)
MTERDASTTAIGVAMLRAAHLLFDGEPRILDDTVVLALLGRGMEAHIRERALAYGEPRAMALRVHVLLRSRYAEERAREAMLRGVTQFLQLGAGLDTFAYRQPEWAVALRIFEVDHPASQTAKRERLGATGISVPSNVTFAPIDFENDTLVNGLARAGFDPAAKTFVSCLGVLVYLTREAIDGLFTFIAALPAGSECAFTFGGTRGTDEPNRPSLATAVAALGEPFQSSMEFDDVRAVLARAGLPEPTQPADAEIATWLGARTDRLARPKRNRLASVVVGG